MLFPLNANYLVLRVVQLAGVNHTFHLWCQRVAPTPPGDTLFETKTLTLATGKGKVVPAVVLNGFSLLKQQSHVINQAGKGLWWVGDVSDTESEGSMNPQKSGKKRKTSSSGQRTSSAADKFNNNNNNNNNPLEDGDTSMPDSHRISQN